MISAKRVFNRSRMRRALTALALSSLATVALPAMAGAATPGPAWSITTTSNSPTNFAPGDSSGSNLYVIHVTNVGSEATDGSPITITDTLPLGLTAKPEGNGLFTAMKLLDQTGAFSPLVSSCEPGPPVRCVGSGAGAVIHPGEKLLMFVPVNVAANAPATVTNQVSVTGGGAAGASASTQTTISPDPAPFGFQSFTSALTGVDGAPETRAGSHPYQVSISAQFNTVLTDGGLPAAPPVENPKNITADLPAGLVLNPHATPTLCTEAQLEFSGQFGESGCPDSSAVGIVHLAIGLFGHPAQVSSTPIYNMVPPPGAPASLAFNATGFGFFIHLLGKVRSDGDYGLSSDTLDIPQYGSISGVTVDLWGDPSDPSHDFRRGRCGNPGWYEPCPVPASDIPLLTMPSACSGPLEFGIKADSWQDPGDFASASVETKDAAGNPVSVTGCDKLDYAPATESAPSTERAETGSGLDFNVDFPNNGLGEHDALNESSTTKAVVTLPKGLTINPSVGEGLGFCTPSQYKAETVSSAFGEACPADAKVGTLYLETPLVDEALNGSVFLAQQDDPTTSTPGAENPFDTDIALYLILKNPVLGVLVKQALKVVPDPKTGQLVATLEDIPALPFNHFNFHFREGARAALITPPACGKYSTEAKLYPASQPSKPAVITSSFEITQGVGGGPCPTGGVPPLNPSFQAGAINNNAGSFSPFNMRLTRKDGEQDLTKFSSILPPGELGSLAGVAKCADAAIESAKSKTGRQELASPSCPVDAQIGRTLAGAGVGDALSYVPGKLYLAGPYKGAPLSVVSITPALAGPFDAGTVVVRLALNLNPKTAEVEVDGANSDPIPHILKGIILKIRDLRVFVDRPNFTLNPTSCEEFATKATLFGSFLDVFSPADDVAVGLSDRYQAADCAALGYKPTLKLNLKGGTRRGGHPGLLATFKPKPGNANTEGIVVRLPRSAFLDQSHIRTICTRVQFAADACPKAAQYGYVKAFTPLLDEPLQGPVWLRSSDHKLPDLVFDLRGLVDVEVATRIDSVNGGIRASIEDAPDAPLSKVELRMQGGKKGLIVNSRNLCGAISRANVELNGHNGKLSKSNPVMRADGCGGKRKGKRGRG